MQLSSRNKKKKRRRNEDRLLLLSVGFIPAKTEEEGREERTFSLGNINRGVRLDR